MLGWPWGCLDPEVVDPGCPGIAGTSSLQTFTCQCLRSAFSSGLLGSPGGCELVWLHRCVLGLPGRPGCWWQWEGRPGALVLECPGSAGWMEGRLGAVPGWAPSIAQSWPSWEAWSLQ